MAPGSAGPQNARENRQLRECLATAELFPRSTCGWDRSRRGVMSLGGG